jgi:hypothetical protein
VKHLFRILSLFFSGDYAVVVVVDLCNYAGRHGNPWNHAQRRMYRVRLEREDCRLQVFVKAMRGRGPHHAGEQSKDDQQIFHWAPLNCTP